MSKIKVVHYINQFFAQIGGEEKADYPAEIRVGEVVGPGLALTQNFKDEAEIIATVICGDSYFNENLEKAKADILAMVKEQAPDVFIAGPAFNAGRYGVACGTIAAAVQEELGIPAVTGMYVENPGADMFKNDVYMISTKNSAAGMRDAVKKLAPLAVKLAKGEKIPFDPTDATIYYVGPTPAKPGQVIGSAGPTTSGRMDAYAPTMMSVGARGMIGKGARLPEVVEAMKKYHGVYFGAIGGAGALLAKCIKKAELIAYEDLGAEALRRLEVEDMPLFVIIDCDGNNLYEMGRKEYLEAHKED